MEAIKNLQLLPILEGIDKLKDLKLGGVKIKILLKNKKLLIAAHELLEDVKKKLIEQYANTLVEGQEVTFTPENQELINKEWKEVNLQDSGVVLIKMNSAELDQFSDLTLEQMEILDLMSE
jgi:hypothetical protein